MVLIRNLFKTKITMASVALGLVACSSWLGNPPDKDPKGTGPTKTSVLVEVDDDHSPAALQGLRVLGKDGQDLGEINIQEGFLAVKSIAFASISDILPNLGGPFVFDFVNRTFTPALPLDQVPTINTAQLVMATTTHSFGEPGESLTLIIKAVHTQDGVSRNLTVKIARTEQVPLTREGDAPTAVLKDLLVKLKFVPVDLFDFSGTTVDLSDLPAGDIDVHGDASDAPSTALAEAIWSNALKSFVYTVTGRPETTDPSGIGGILDDAKDRVDGVFDSVIPKPGE